MKPRQRRLGVRTRCVTCGKLILAGSMVFEFVATGKHMCRDCGMGVITSEQEGEA